MDHQLGDIVGITVPGHGLWAPRPTHGLGIEEEQLVFDHGAQDLVDEERVACGLLMYLCSQCQGGFGIHVVALGDQLCHRANGQRSQVQGGAAQCVGDADWALGSVGVAALGKDQQQVAGCVCLQLRQELPRGVVDPLDIVDEQHQWQAGAAEYCKEFDHGPQLLLQRHGGKFAWQWRQRAEH